MCRNWVLRVVLPIQQKTSGALRYKSMFLIVEFIEAVASAEQQCSFTQILEY